MAGFALSVAGFALICSHIVSQVSIARMVISADWINKIISLTGERMPTMNARLSPITGCLLGKSSTPQRGIAAAWSLGLCLAVAGTQSAVAQNVTEPAVVPTPLAG